MGIRVLYIWILAVLAAAFCGCSSKRFEVSASFSSAPASASLDLSYYVFGSDGGVFRQEALPLVKGAGSGEFAVVYPSVAFISDNTGLVKIPVFIERGSALKISGPYSDPMKWKVEGGRENEEISSWRVSNEAVIASRESSKINKAVADFVKGHKDSCVSAILLLVYFDRSYAPEEFDSLWGMLSDDAAPRTLVESLGASVKVLPTAGSKGTVKGGGFYSSGDTIVSVMPADSPYTLFYFWERRGTHSSGASVIREALRSRKNVSVVDVNMGPDTIGWRNTLAIDSTASWITVWTPGGEMNDCVREFHVEHLPFYVLVDSKGRQIYRGASPDEAVGKLK